MSDILHDALRDATLAALLGSTEVIQTTVMDGSATQGTITIPSAFLMRIQQQAYKGEYDGLIAEAMAKVTPEDLAETIKQALSQQMLKGLENERAGYGQTPTPGWLQRQARTIAAEAMTAAAKDDEGLMETLRQTIGIQVDRNRVGINVTLSDPET